MKIQEIQLYKDLKDIDYSRDMISVIERYGWKVLGWGFEGVVAEHPNKPYVLKLFTSQSKYAKFVNLVQRHPNPHFPKFSKYIRPIKGTIWSYVRMEKLTPVQEADLRTKFFSEMCYMYLSAKEKHMTISQEIVLLLNRVWGTTSLEEVDEEDFIKEAKGADIQWIDAIEFIMDEAKYRLGLNHIDLHEENLMLRNETLVILDPFY